MVGSLILMTVMSLGVLENKDVVVFFSGEGCQPCHRMLEGTLKDKRVRMAMRGKLLLVVDVRQHADLAKHYGVEKIPTYVRLVKLKEVNRGVGYLGPTKFIKWLQRKQGDRSDG